MASGRWRPSPDPALARWAWPPRIATRALGADPGPVRTARDFTVATLHRRGMAERSPDIAMVVSELRPTRCGTPCPGPALPGPGGRSGSACCSPGHGCCAQSPTRARPLRHRERPAPSTRPAADCTSSARSATSGATPRPARPERSGGPRSARGRHRRLRPGPEQARPRPVPEPDNLAQPASVNDPSPGRPWLEHRALACRPHPQVTRGSLSGAGTVATAFLCRFPASLSDSRASFPSGFLLEGS